MAMRTRGHITRHSTPVLWQSAAAPPDPSRLGAYFAAYALNSAGVVDDTALATAAGIDRRTAQSYASLLADLGVVSELSAWSTNVLKRLVRMPKRQVADSGLLGAAIGADATFVMSNGEALGRLIETFVANQLLAEAPFDPLRPRWHHLRERADRRLHARCLHDDDMMQ